MDLEKILADMDALLQEDQATLDELEAQAAEVRSRVSRLEKSRRALRSETSPSSKPKPRSAKYANKYGPSWQPNPESVRDILATLARADAEGPMTIKDIEKATRWSHSHVDSTMRYLRRHEMIRLAGKRGTANVYAPMTNTGLKETEHVVDAA